MFIDYFKYIYFTAKIYYLTQRVRVKKRGRKIAILHELNLYKLNVYLRRKFSATF